MIKVRPASAGPSYATSPRPAPHYGSGTRGRRDRCLMRDRGGDHPRGVSIARLYPALLRRILKTV